ncbi:MAG: histidinol phosphate phosphatase domain-containing protein [Capsulimonadaceae bacterium]|nr:histidinol phosphate phosphatase domain-containing protein [Capsulimonadaceae bacterium]
MALYDFHMHTFFSDGELLPTELIRRCIDKGYSALAITDHASASNIPTLLDQLRRDAELVMEHWGFQVLPGVELTHVPPASIAKLARQAKDAGAQVVVVHGETLVEPVPPGTNQASVECPDVDILAHPGLLTLEQAKLAERNGLFLEITSRGGHCLGNGNTALVARETGALLLVNSDTHAPRDIHTEAFARVVAQGAGLSDIEVEQTLHVNPLKLIARVGQVRA